jgi:hypothetical protein
MGLGSPAGTQERTDSKSDSGRDSERLLDRIVDPGHIFVVTPRFIPSSRSRRSRGHSWLWPRFFRKRPRGHKPALSAPVIRAETSLSPRHCAGLNLFTVAAGASPPV